MQKQHAFHKQAHAFSGRTESPFTVSTEHKSRIPRNNKFNPMGSRGKKKQKQSRQFSLMQLPPRWKKISKAPLWAFVNIPALIHLPTDHRIGHKNWNGNGGVCVLGVGRSDISHVTSGNWNDGKEATRASANPPEKWPQVYSLQVWVRFNPGGTLHFCI